MEGCSSPQGVSDGATSAAPAVRASVGDVQRLDLAASGDDRGVLGAAVTGEDHAVSEYEKALEQDLSAGFREVVSQQHAEVVAARDEVKALHVAH